MGLAISKGKKEDKKDDKPITHDVRELPVGPREVRVLLLGSGDTGKRYESLFIFFSFVLI
jgi:hypothetical protein